MKKINKGIDIYPYLDYFNTNDSVINTMREDFNFDVNKIFSGNVVIISEEEMMEVNNLIGGEYPHCYSR